LILLSAGVFSAPGVADTSVTDLLHDANATKTVMFSQSVSGGTDATLSATPSVYGSDLSMTSFRVPNEVRLDISFTNSTVVTDVGFSSSSQQDCGPEIVVSYTGGTTFPLGASSPRAAFFNGHLPGHAADLCVGTSGTIALDGIITNLGACPVFAGCYSYTCDHVGGSITGITPITPFTATCL